MKEVTTKELEELIKNKDSVGDIVVKCGDDVIAFGKCNSISDGNGDAITRGDGNVTIKGG